MPVGGIDRIHAAARVGHIHRPVHDDRRRLVADAVDDAVLEKPTRHQRLHVGSVDLRHRRVAGAGQIEVVQGPVDCLIRILGSQWCGQRGDGDADDQKMSFHDAAQFLARARSLTMS